MWTSTGGEELLFNMETDPMEQVNLAKTESEKAEYYKKLLTEQVQSYNPGLVKDGMLIVKSAINSPDDVSKWPGFHSTYYPTDVLH